MIVRLCGLSEERLKWLYQSELRLVHWLTQPLVKVYSSIHIHSPFLHQNPDLELRITSLKLYAASAQSDLVGCACRFSVTMPPMEHLPSCTAPSSKSRPEAPSSSCECSMCPSRDMRAAFPQQCLHNFCSDDESVSDQAKMVFYSTHHTCVVSSSKRSGEDAKLIFTASPLH